MGEKTTIAWTNASWNPVIGCSHVSPGCEHCYAETLALRYGWSKKPWGAQNAAENVVLKPNKLDLPLRWREPRMIFVNSLSDVFHEQIPDEYIAKIFAVMALTPWHTYQILTKRPERMLRYLIAPLAGPLAGRSFVDGGPEPEAHRRIFDAMGATIPSCPVDVLNRASDWQDRVCPDGAGLMRSWPLPNVWLGVSVEDQRRADERIPLLLQTPAAVRFLSCEPLLGPLAIWSVVERFEAAGGESPNWSRENPYWIHWVIAGGESGSGYRPMNLDWARSIRDECRAAGVAFFYKQSSGPRPGMNATLDGVEYHEFPIGLPPRYGEDAMLPGLVTR